MYGQVPKHGWMCLDAVALFVVIGEVKEFKGQICPYTVKGFRVQLSHVHHNIL